MHKLEVILHGEMERASLLLDQSRPPFIFRNKGHIVLHRDAQRDQMACF